MSKQKDGGSAFPVFDGRGGADYQCVDGGMSQLDLYSAFALQGLLANSKSREYYNDLVVEAFNLGQRMVVECNARRKAMEAKE